MDELKEKWGPPGDSNRLRDVGSLMLVGHGNKVFMTHFSET